MRLRPMAFAATTLLVALSFQAIPSPILRTYQQYPADQNTNGSKAPSQPAPPQEQGGTNQNTNWADNNSHDNMPWWEDAGLATWVLVLIGFLGTIAALCTLWVINKQSGDIKKAADAAFLNAQALIASERAWIDIELTPQADAPSMYDLKITNHGRTPALVLTYTVGTQSYPPDEYLWSTAKTFDMMKASYKKLADLRVFLKQSDSHSTKAVTDLSHAFIAWDALRNGQQSGLLYFGVSYLDIVSGTNAAREPRESAAIFSFAQDTQSLYRMNRYDKYK